MTKKEETAKKAAHSLIPGSEIDIKNIERSLNGHFKHGIRPTAAIFLILASISLIATFIITPLLEVMTAYYASPQQASQLLKDLLPDPSPQGSHPPIYHILRKVSTTSTIITPILAAMGLLMHIRTKGKGFKFMRKNNQIRKKNNTKPPKASNIRQPNQ